jgi:cell division septum initiation protein DivIVA
MSACDTVTNESKLDLHEKLRKDYEAMLVKNTDLEQEVEQLKVKLQSLGNKLMEKTRQASSNED